MDTVLCAGYPKTGNTLLGEALNHAGGVTTSFDIYFLKSQGISPKANSLFDVDCCSIKTHNSHNPYHNLDKLYFGKVLKIVVINRNPFDMLLSAINFFRFAFKRTSGKFDPAGQYLRSLRMLIPDFKITDSFLLDFTLENLRDTGMLDIALRNFGENGTSILHFHKLSGAWADFSASYDQADVSLLKCSYEDLEKISISSTVENDSISKELLNLSSFLEVDAMRLKTGFAQQRQSLSSEKSNSKDSVKFFNKSRSGYWKEYFSQKECKYFLGRNYASVIRNGYEGLIEEVELM